MIPTIVLAGGLGTRLAAVSGGLPKPMVEVAGRPFIEHVLDFLVDAGVSELFLAVSYRWDQLHQHLGDSYRGAPITYSVEQEPLGTGGALLQCFRQYGLERALVLNGDTLFRIDVTGLLQTHLQARALITMALRSLPDTSRYGVVTCGEAGRIQAFHEKSGRMTPGLINGGIYVVERVAFERIKLPEKFSFERDFLQEHVLELQPQGMTSDAYFIDIGIPEDLQRARHELAVRG